MKSDRDIWTSKNSKLQTVTRKFMQKLTVYAENLHRNLLFMQKIYPKINQKIYAETVYVETYCLCRKFMQKLQTVTRKFVQKITVYAENLCRNNAKIFRWVW